MADKDNQHSKSQGGGGSEQPESTSGAGPLSGPNPEQLARAVGLPSSSAPPIPTQQIPQMLGIQLGVGLPQQQNPEVIAHITAFLAHDSDNRLKAVNSTGERNHTFRLAALCIGTFLAVLFFGLPLGVELYRGDVVFVRDFVEKYLPVASMIVLALLAGPKVAELFKG